MYNLTLLYLSHLTLFFTKFNNIPYSEIFNCNVYLNIITQLC